MSIDEIEAEALKLSPEERVRLAERLLSSVSRGEEVEEAWVVEVERRIADIEAGRATVVPAADAIARARASLM